MKKLILFRILAAIILFVSIISIGLLTASKAYAGDVSVPIDLNHVPASHIWVPGRADHRFSGRCTDTNGVDYDAGQHSWISTRNANATCPPLDPSYPVHTFNRIDSISASGGAQFGGVSAGDVIQTFYTGNGYYDVTYVPIQLTIPNNLSAGSYTYTVDYSSRAINQRQNNNFQCVGANVFKSNGTSDFSGCPQGGGSVSVQVNVVQNTGRIVTTKVGPGAQNLSGVCVLPDQPGALPIQCSTGNMNLEVGDNTRYVVDSNPVAGSKLVGFRLRYDDGRGLFTCHVGYYDNSGDGGVNSYGPLCATSGYNSNTNPYRFGNIPVAKDRTTFIDLFYDPSPNGNFESLNCDYNANKLRAEGWALDLSSSNSKVKVVFYQRDSSGNLTYLGNSFDTIADKTTTNNGNSRAGENWAGVPISGHIFNTTLQNIDGNVHDIYAYALGINPDGSLNNDNTFIGNRAIRCTPTPIFKPWLQTKSGDVISQEGVKGQEFFQPGSRSFWLAEGATYSASPVIVSGGNSTPTTCGFSPGAGTPAGDIIGTGPDIGSINPSLNVVQFSAQRTLQSCYSGPISAIAIRSRSKSVDNSNATFRVDVRNNANNSIVKTFNITTNTQYSQHLETFTGIPPNGILTSSDYSIFITNTTNGADANHQLDIDQMIVYGDNLKLGGSELSYSLISPQDSGANNYFCSINQYVLGKPIPSKQCIAGNYPLNNNVVENFSKVRASLQNIEKSGACVTNGLPGNSADISAGCPGGRLYIVSGNATLNAISPSSGKATIWVKNGTLTINGNIGNPSSVGNINNLLNVAFIADGGNIAITNAVTNLKASLISIQQNSDNNTGKILTCAGFAITTPACSNQLVVNGLFASQGLIEFGRRYYLWSSPGQNPAEVINLPGEVIVAPPPGLDGNAGDIDGSLQFNKGELAPRLN
jgi:hypothetical protein